MMSKSERLMVGGLIAAAVDSSYLTWRYLALRLGIVTPGTSICSWTAFIDCDRVLLRPEANAFFVPNALLGAAFYISCLIWWHAGKRLGDAYRFHLIRTLTFWLGVATLFTLRFFWLLVHLPNFCPLCPLNHFATYAALIGAVFTLRGASPPRERFALRPLIVLVVSCVALFAVLQGLWFWAEMKGVLRLPR